MRLFKQISLINYLTVGIIPADKKKLYKRRTLLTREFEWFDSTILTGKKCF